jgi:predicted acyltransferase
MSTVAASGRLVAEAPSSSTRLMSLDVFRGATIAAMILVNDPGDGRVTYWPLEHARWSGWTPTDLVFPFFVFIVGVAMAFSFRSRLERESGPALFACAVAWFSPVRAGNIH